MQQKEAASLLKKYLAGHCTEDEKALLETWYLHYEQQELPEVSEFELRKQRDEIQQLLPVQKHEPKGRPLWIKMAAAVAMLIIASFGMYLSYKQGFLASNQGQTTQIVGTDIKPGGNRATLVLADGSTILLNDVAEGELSQQAGVKIAKTADGQLRYFLTENKPAENNSNQFNIIRTPKGGQYQVALSDGTQVWLNAESSIKIPLSFTDKKRVVEITGEAYFEVAENKNRPFYVQTNDVTIQVLGTHFNIMAYPEEGKVAATLTAGAIKLAYKNQEALLKPGEQGIVRPEMANLEVRKVETAPVLAWKNGLFQFDNTDLHTLMRQLSRWYDIEIAYEDGVKNEIFRGKIARDAALSKVLKILRLGDVNFRVEGKKLIVMP